MAGRNKEPVNLLLAKGKTHLTQAEIDRRRAEEVNAPDDSITAPSLSSPRKQRDEFHEIADALVALKIMTNLDCDALARLHRRPGRLDRSREKAPNKAVQGVRRDVRRLGADRGPLPPPDARGCVGSRAHNYLAREAGHAQERRTLPRRRTSLPYSQVAVPDDGSRDGACRGGGQATRSAEGCRTAPPAGVQAPPEGPRAGWNISFSVHLGPARCRTGPPVRGDIDRPGGHRPASRAPVGMPGIRHRRNLRVEEARRKQALPPALQERRSVRTGRRSRTASSVPTSRTSPGTTTASCLP